MKAFITLVILGGLALGLVVVRMEISRSGREISKLQNRVEVQEHLSRHAVSAIALLSILWRSGTSL